MNERRALGPRQANKHGNEHFPVRRYAARWTALDTASKNGGRESVSDADVGEDRLQQGAVLSNKG